jgi:3-hexulose-6-phosphate synthase
VKLQLAIDCFTLEAAENIVREVGDLVDIVEAGTPLILREGIAAVEKLKDLCPGKPILADMKIIDGAEYETRLAFDAGADIVTVLAAAEDRTIAIARDTAEKYAKSVMVDLIGVTDVRSRAAEIDGFGVDYLCVHRATDLGAGNAGALEELGSVKDVMCKSEIAVAGGVDVGTIRDIVAEDPDIVIVGSFITGSENRREAARRMREGMNP